MKARLFVVNEETMKKTLDTMEVSVMVPEPEGRLWNKTVLDIVCDLMQVDIGDYIFLWESGTENIYGVFRAVSRPFCCDDVDANDIFRIKIDMAYDFKKPINEYDVINNPYMKNKLWNIIGKKVAGKSRGTSPITNEEMQFLLQSLIDVNDDYNYYDDYSVVDVENELKFDFEHEFNNDIPDRLSDYNYAPFRVLKGNNVQYEKALEGVLNCCLRDKDYKTVKQLGIDANKVVWYANYLPYGLERSEIDYMIMESQDGVNISRIDVIELMSDIIDKDHIRRCLQYAKWVASSLTNEKNIVRPILVCGEKSITSKNGFSSEDIRKSLELYPNEYGFDSLDVYTYSGQNKGIIFKKKGESENE